MTRAAAHAGLTLLSSMMLAACVTACAAGDSGSSGDEPEAARSPETTERPVETTRPSKKTHPERIRPKETRPGKRGKAGDLNVEQLTSEAPGQGPKRPRVLMASSASDLSRRAGVKVADTGEGTYLAAFWGEKPTGGYSLEIRSARAAGNRVTIRLALREPPPDAMLTQALTYPYAAAVIRNEDLTERDFLLKDQRGRELDWPVRSLGAGGSPEG